MIDSMQCNDLSLMIQVTSPTLSRRRGDNEHLESVESGDGSSLSLRFATSGVLPCCDWYYRAHIRKRSSDQSVSHIVCSRKANFATGAEFARFLAVVVFDLFSRSTRMCDRCSIIDIVLVCPSLRACRASCILAPRSVPFSWWIDCLSLPQ